MKTILLFCFLQMLVFLPAARAELENIGVGEDGVSFAGMDSGKKFVVWGFNYDHDNDGNLLEDYWEKEWTRVAEDFSEMKALGANVLRVHLQLGKFMNSATETNVRNLAQLKKLVTLAEKTGLYLDITGLACYHKKDVPKWYDALAEADRWEVQVRFWKAVAGVCKNSPAIFCYDLMNEPVLTGGENPKEWLTGELGGSFFVQRITLDLAGRTSEDSPLIFTKPRPHFKPTHQAHGGMAELGLRRSIRNRV